MRWPLTPLLSALALAVTMAACGGDVDNTPIVATPALTLSSPTAAIGSPLEMTYRFAVAADAPAFAESYWVFVHFVDADGELMWTDDHQPPTPTTQWKAGSTVEYTRTMFVPKFPYVGQTRVEVGLYSPSSGERLPMGGESAGLRSYRVAAFDMRLQSDNAFVVFRDGWYETETGGDTGALEWQWSKKLSTLSFRNPKRDAEIFVQLDQPVTGTTEPQNVELRVGTAVIDSFPLPPGKTELRRVQVPASTLGTADTVDLSLSVDRTFVPASVPSLRNNDARELGVRVFRVFVQPK